MTTLRPVHPVLGRAFPLALAALLPLASPARATAAPPVRPAFDRFAPTATPQIPTTGDPFERGLALLGDGNVEDALSLWIAARDSLLEVGEEDARIATAFIRVVTERELVRYEEIASVVFLWGFSGNAATGAAREEILAEGRRTFAVADSTAVEYWDDVGREDPARLARAIKRFWVERDPTPATLLNERLIEHWRRIAFARRNFVYNRTSPYRTDDRGTLYVRYGTPDRVTRGTLGPSQADLRERRVTIDQMSGFDVAPQYEIWRYANMHPPDFTYFLFGNTDGTGPFHHVEGVHRLLPPSARLVSASIDGVRPQHFMELFYYQDLARMGGPYGLRYAELDRLWSTSWPRPRPTEGSLEAASRRFIADDQFAARQPVPPPISEFDDRPRSALSAQTARILDAGLPRLLVLAVSSPIWLPSADLEIIGDSLALNAWTASHTVIARDRALAEIARAGMLPADGPGHLSTLLLRHDPGIRHLSVSARHDVHDGGEDTGDAPAPGRLPGHEHFAIGAPLLAVGDSVAGDSAPFEASDLVVGIAPRPELDLGELPVPLLPATRFWRADLLRVYFELYRPGPVSGAGTVEVQVHLTPVTRASPAIPLPTTEELNLETAAIVVPVESPDARGEHFFDLDLRNELPGLLRVVVEITDQATGVTRVRSTPVRLLEN